VPVEGRGVRLFRSGKHPRAPQRLPGRQPRARDRSPDWLTLLASYTWSESEGNIEYTQNFGDDFNVYPWHFDNPMATCRTIGSTGSS